MSLPDLWSNDVLVPRERPVSRQFAVVPRDRIYGKQPEPPPPHVVLAERREREVREAWRKGFEAAAARFKFTTCSPAAMHRICAEVAAKHGMTVADLTCDRRGKKIVLARHEAMWRCFKETQASYPAIGRVLNKDHTSVMHGVARHEERMAKEAAAS